MTDIYDQATEREELDRSLAMAYRKPAPSACGACHNCNEPVNPGRIFCCAECCEDYELREKMRGIHG